MKRRKLILIVAILLLAGIGCWIFFANGVSHREIKATVLDEGAATRAHVDRRADALEERLDRLERKLDRLERKLDLLLDRTTPRLPDDLRPAE